jgi:hypothetical protein
MRNNGAVVVGIVSKLFVGAVILLLGVDTATSGKNFAIAAWNSRRTAYFQAVGDPLLTR